MHDQIKRSLKRLLSRAGYSIRRSDELTALADEYGSDKGNAFYAHGYARIYNRLFTELRHSEITFVEIGLLRADVDGRRASNVSEGVAPASAHEAPSLRMWKRYFDRAQIFGFDIDDFSGLHIDRCSIVQGDMSRPEDLSRLISTVARSIDILIEDGSHASHHQQIAFGELFPHISPGGIYIIEDLHWQDPLFEKDDAPKTRDILRRLSLDGVLLESPYISPLQRNYIEKNTLSVTLFDSLTSVSSDPTDALAVVVKK
jgi:hypothetical protein